MYRILERIVSRPTYERYRVVGEGFQSFTAVWLAAIQEVNRRLQERPEGAVFAFCFTIERVEGAMVDRVGKLTLHEENLDRMPGLELFTQ